MSSASLFFRKLDPARRAYILGATAACIIVAGIFAEDAMAYFCIAIPAIVPLVLWLQAGAPGIPVLPAVSGLFFVYYAIPLLRGNIAAFGSDALVSAGITIGAFLLAASLVSWPFLVAARRSSGAPRSNLVSDAQIVRLVFVGLAAGSLFHLATISGALDALGSSVGLVRSVVLTLGSVACYLLGCARASRALVGARWVAAAGGLCALILLSLSNLFLVSGIMNGLAAVFGYVMTRKRIPWVALGTAFILLSVLHAGKFEMRERYWLPHSQSLQQSSIYQVPGMLTDWVTAGVGALLSGRAESDVLERASLLHMLLLVERATPSFVPYLEGQTYAMLPSMLVPRFVDADKLQSQAVLNLLSLRYGLQQVGSSESTTIGWGLIAEAYANYGDPAVVAVGAVFGALCGALMLLSSGAAPLSTRMLVTIAATLTLFNLELDLSYLLTALAQSIAAILLLATIPKLLGRRRRPRPLVATGAGLAPGPLGDASSPR